MDYTTLAQVLGLIGNENPTPRPTPAPYDDTVIAEAITAASRAIDREVTGAGSTDSDDYFKSETKSLVETGPALVDRLGDLKVWLRKPYVSAITVLQYRYSGADAWETATITSVTVSGYLATYWGGLLTPGPVMCRATYVGGLAAAQVNMPAELQRAAAILAARYYKEGKAGLGDTIGVAELGTMQYTQAIPLEVLRILSPWQRPVPW